MCGVSLSEEIGDDPVKRADTRRVFQEDMGCHEEREPDSPFIKSLNPENQLVVLRRDEPEWGGAEKEYEQEKILPGRNCRTGKGGGEGGG